MTDSAVYRTQGFGQRMGFGLRPALLIVDFINGFNDPGVFGGGNIGAAIERTVDLLAAARRHKLPIVFTRHVYAADGSDRGLFNLKNPSLNRLQKYADLVPCADVLHALASIRAAAHPEGLTDAHA